jgi:hypothetical protein
MFFFTLTIVELGTAVLWKMHSSNWERSIVFLRMKYRLTEHIPSFNSERSIVFLGMLSLYNKKGFKNYIKNRSKYLLS